MIVRFTYNAIRYILVVVIVSFRCQETEKVFNRERSRKFVNIERVAYRHLRYLHDAESLSDLAGAGMSLEALKRDRKGRHAIRVSGQYRICFTWRDGKASDVEIVDYH